MIFSLELGGLVHRYIQNVKIQPAECLLSVHYSICKLCLHTKCRNVIVQNGWNSYVMGIFFLVGQNTFHLSEILYIGKGTYDLFLVKKQIQAKKNRHRVEHTGED